MMNSALRGNEGERSYCIRGAAEMRMQISVMQRSAECTAI